MTSRKLLDIPLLEGVFSACLAMYTQHKSSVVVMTDSLAAPVSERQSFSEQL